MKRQFRCYKCSEITKYDPKEYDDLLKSEILVVAWREMIYYIKCDHCQETNRVEVQTFSDQIDKKKGHEDIIDGKPLRKEEDFYLSLAGEFIKNNSKFVNEVLRQFITLNTALLAGTVTFINKEIINENYKIVVVFCFLISLIISFVGTIPYSGGVSFSDPHKVKTFSENALNYKLKFLKASGIISGIGFLVIIIGMIIKLTKT